MDYHKNNLSRQELSVKNTITPQDGYHGHYGMHNECDQLRVMLCKRTRPVNKTHHVTAEGQPASGVQPRRWASENKRGSGTRALEGHERSK